MDMTIIAIVIIVAFLAQGVAMWFMFGRNTSKGEESTATLLLQKQIENLERSLDSRMSESSKAMNETMRTQLGESSRLIKDITQELTSVKEIGRTTQGFAEELRSLQDILKNPKQRGVLGEYYLETVLKNVLPPGTYKIQYPFKNGDIVDAALFIQDRIIPIDSKFSLENYNRFIGAAL